MRTPPRRSPRLHDNTGESAITGVEGDSGARQCPTGETTDVYGLQTTQANPSGIAETLSLAASKSTPTSTGMASEVAVPNDSISNMASSAAELAKKNAVIFELTTNVAKQKVLSEKSNMACSTAEVQRGAGLSAELLRPGQGTDMESTSEAMGSEFPTNMSPQLAPLLSMVTNLQHQLNTAMEAIRFAATTGSVPVCNPVQPNIFQPVQPIAANPKRAPAVNSIQLPGANHMQPVAANTDQAPAVNSIQLPGANHMQPIAANPEQAPAVNSIQLPSAKSMSPVANAVQPPAGSLEQPSAAYLLQRPSVNSMQLSGANHIQPIAANPEQAPAVNFIQLPSATLMQPTHATTGSHGQNFAPQLSPGLSAYFVQPPTHPMQTSAAHQMQPPVDLWAQPYAGDARTYAPSRLCTDSNGGKPPYAQQHMGSPQVSVSNAWSQSRQMDNSSVHDQLMAASLACPNIQPPRQLQDLPHFDGNAEDWPVFLTAYVQSTTAYRYNNFENNQRLLKALRGEAKKAVKCLLIHPDNVTNAVEQLRLKFGRPNQLIHSQLREVRELPQLSENSLSKLPDFATKVNNLAVFLQAIDGQQHINNPTLLDEIVQKLPMSKKMEWAKMAMQLKPYPTVVHLSAWLGEMAAIINSIQDVEKEGRRRVLLATDQNREKEPAQHSKPQQQSTTSCPFCNMQHKLEACAAFTKLDIKERWNWVKRHRVCFACFQRAHSKNNCPKKTTCSTNGCTRRHHPLLHEDTTNPPPSNVLSCVTSQSNKLLFRILPVTLYGENCQMDIYALFDDGSSITMLDQEVANQLGVRGSAQNLNIHWFGGRSASEKVTAFNIHVRGQSKTKRHLMRNVYAVSNLNLPAQSLSQEEINRAMRNGSGNMTPYTDIVPKLLIGLDHAHLGMPMSIKKPQPSAPIATHTKLGWLVYGPSPSNSLSHQSACLLVDVHRDASIDKMVTDFFNVESIGVRAAPLIESCDDIRAKEILNATTKRVEGRFETGLLWRTNDIKLPNSYNSALRRLDGMDKKMMSDNQFALAYKGIIEGYVEKGYARMIPDEELHTQHPRTWYLPHFAVFNPNKPSKIRLVFDAAATTSDVSLNSMLLKGPQDIELLPNIIFNFRRGQVAVCGDIREMYHQVLVRSEDRCSQRFLWRNGDRNVQPMEYEMRVMTFGAACSPCSARYVLKTNALEQHCSSRARNAIIKHHYVDDYVDSFDTTDEAIKISSEVVQIHAKGGFELRGFTSNSQQVCSALGGSSENKNLLSSESVEKVLGIYWDCLTDHFKYSLKFHRVDDSVIDGKKTPTKRELLSIIMSTFDPMGFLGHFIVGGKLLLREVWRRGCKWDESIPLDVANSWEIWRIQLHAVGNFRIPRCYFVTKMPSDLELHIFVDASEFAFAAVAYWRYIEDGLTHISFVSSKTKCAPMKTGAAYLEPYLKVMNLLLTPTHSGVIRKLCCAGLIVSTGNTSHT